MKQLLLLLSLIVVPSMLFWCTNTSDPGEKPSWFFGWVFSEYPNHPGVKLSQLHQFSSFIKDNKEVHISWVVEQDVIKDIAVFSWFDSPLEIDIHLFDTTEIEVGSKELHTIHLKWTILFSKSDVSTFESDLYLIREVSSSNHYLFIDEFRFQHSWDVPYLSEFWTSFINSQRKKRINVWNPHRLSYLESGRILNKIDANMTNSRVMQWLDKSSIFSSEGEELLTQLEILDQKKVLTLDFIKEKTLLVLSNAWSEYTVDGDIQSDVYGGKIQWSAVIKGDAQSATITSNSKIEFPKWLEISLITRSKKSAVSELDTDLQIPSRYIDSKKILPK